MNKYKSLVLSTGFLVATLNINYAQSCAPNETDAGPNPTGWIVVEPNQPGAGSESYLIAAGLTLNCGVTGLGDQDCDCGKLVDDTIDKTVNADFNWVLDAGSSAGSIDEQNAAGESTNFTTPAVSTATGIGSLTAKVKDENVPKNPGDKTAQDYTSLQPLDVITIIVVVPNLVSTTSAPGTCPTTVLGGPQYGSPLDLTDTIQNTQDSSGSMDFSGYMYGERSGFIFIGPNQCGVGSPATGAPAAAITGNQLPGIVDHERMSCSPDDTVTDSCMTTIQTQWYFEVAGSSTAINFMRRNYTMADASGTGLRDHVVSSYHNMSP